MGARPTRSRETMDLGLIYGTSAGGPHNAAGSGGSDTPTVRLYWEGWQETSRRPEDTLENVSPDKLEQAGRDPGPGADGAGERDRVLERQSITQSHRGTQRRRERAQGVHETAEGHRETEGRGESRLVVDSPFSFPLCELSVPPLCASV